MAAREEIQEVNRQEATTKKARRFDDRDWNKIAEFVRDEYNKRKNARADKEREWTEIDRQIRMEPETAYKKLPNGGIDWKKNWMAELELPLQATALEVMVADARRMLFAESSASWFRAHAEVTDKYLREVEGAGGVKVLGDENYIPSAVNQDNADKLVQGFLLHWFRQYDHTTRFDIINSECFKYGIGVGRARLERKNIWITEARGVRTEKQQIPTIVPCSIKNLYLEEPKPTLHSATVLGPAHIAHDYLKYENLVLAANKGSNDPDDDDGGWMPKDLKKVIPDKRGYVEVLEMEGDIVVPRKHVRSVVLRGVIVTVAVGSSDPGGSSSLAVIRFRFRKYPFSSYLLFPYMYESADDAYAASPLMKGRTVQMAATDAVNRFLDAAMLQNSPPVGYDRNDQVFAQAGGPEIYPGAMWETVDPVKVYAEIGGNPSLLAQAALQLVGLYAELTGVLPSRVGQRTASHTTAYSKQAELQRGSMRTQDYVTQTGHGPLTNWLYMAYRMGRDSLVGNQKISFWIKEYGGYVEVDKSMLPEKSGFEWFGAAGPEEKQQKEQKMLGALQLALKMDQMAIQAGNRPTIDMPAAIREVLREGEWEHLDGIIHEQAQSPAGGAPGGPPAAPGIPGAVGGAGGPQAAALQAVTGGRGGAG